MPSTLNFEKAITLTAVAQCYALIARVGIRVAVSEMSSGGLYYSYERLLTCAKKRKDGIP